MSFREFDHNRIAYAPVPGILGHAAFMPGGSMSEHVYKQVELTGSSKTSVEDAVQNAITKATKTLRNLHWFQVVDTRGYVENGKVDYWQVTIKLGFRVDD
jgi:flavin-binding protein dodecin